MGIVGRNDGIARSWTEAAGIGIDELACVSVLFVDRDLQGQGIGGVLLATRRSLARERGRVPVLDVVQREGTVVEVYRHSGWQEVGRARPAWLPDAEPPVLLMMLPWDDGAAPGDEASDGQRRDVEDEGRFSAVDGLDSSTAHTRPAASGTSMSARSVPDPQGAER